MLSRLGQGRIFLSTGATDMRKSFNGLSGLVRSRLAEDPLSGDLFVFCNRGKNRLKILFFDSTGMWVLAKRLERGTFDWPAELAGSRADRAALREAAVDPGRTRGGRARGAAQVAARGALSAHFVAIKRIVTW